MNGLINISILLSVLYFLNLITASQLGKRMFLFLENTWWEFPSWRFKLSRHLTIRSHSSHHLFSANLLKSLSPLHHHFLSSHTFRGQVASTFKATKNVPAPEAKEHVSPLSYLTPLKPSDRAGHPVLKHFLSLASIWLPPDHLLVPFASSPSSGPPSNAGVPESSIPGSLSFVFCTPP